jgi:hypothetical protein
MRFQEGMFFDQVAEAATHSTHLRPVSVVPLPAGVVCHIRCHRDGLEAAPRIT